MKSAQGRHSAVILEKSAPQAESLLAAAQDHPYQRFILLPPPGSSEVDAQQSLMECILAQYDAGYIKRSDLIGVIEEDNALTLYWFCGQRLTHKTLPNTNPLIAAEVLKLAHSLKEDGESKQSQETAYQMSTSFSGDDN